MDITESCKHCESYLQLSHGCNRIASGLKCQFKAAPGFGDVGYTVGAEHPAALREVSAHANLQAALADTVVLHHDGALATQVGGGHYKDMKIQPVEYIVKNGIGFVEGAVIKYVSRWRKKAGIEDLKKARHMLDLLIELEEQK